MFATTHGTAPSEVLLPLGIPRDSYIRIPMHFSWNTCSTSTLFMPSRVRKKPMSRGIPGGIGIPKGTSVAIPKEFQKGPHDFKMGDLQHSSKEKKNNLND